jgi:hypothetical protein
MLVLLLLLVLPADWGGAEAPRLRCGQPGHRVARWSAAEGFEALKEGWPVTDLVRLIAYDPASQPFLAAERLAYLGVPSEEFIFVADYAELRGYTVAEALAKIGLVLQPGQRVTMIRFPAADRQVLPANAWGVLQAVLAIERQQTMPNGANLERFLTPGEIDRLEQPQSWSWAALGPTHARDTKIVRELLAEKCSAFERIGSIGKDWNSLGFAHLMGQTGIAPANFTLRLGEGAIPVKNFGSRVFLTTNVRIMDLEGAELVDFATPALSRLP